MTGSSPANHENTTYFPPPWRGRVRVGVNNKILSPSPESPPARGGESYSLHNSNFSMSELPKRALPNHIIRLLVIEILVLIWLLVLGTWLLLNYSMRFYYIPFSLLHLSISINARLDKSRLFSRPFVFPWIGGNRPKLIFIGWKGTVWE